MDNIINMIWLMFWIIVTLVLVAVTFRAYFAIFRKAGYSGWLALLGFVPLVNFVTLLWFATAEWPLEVRCHDKDDGKKGDIGYEMKMALRKALALEGQGQWALAVKQFEHVVHLAGSSPNGDLARQHIQQIQTKTTTGDA